MNGPNIGHVVYFIVAGPFVKVGYSNKLHERLKSLQVGNPYELVVAHTIGYESMAEALAGEKFWRAQLAHHGKSASGEWVELEYDVLGPLVRNLYRDDLKHSWSFYRHIDANPLPSGLEGGLALMGLRARVGETA